MNFMNISRQIPHNSPVLLLMEFPFSIATQQPLLLQTSSQRPISAHFLEGFDHIETTGRPNSAEGRINTLSILHIQVRVSTYYISQRNRFCIMATSNKWTFLLLRSIKIRE